MIYYFKFKGFGNKNITLYDIRAELNYRYKDLRMPHMPPTGEELAQMLLNDDISNIQGFIIRFLKKNCSIFKENLYLVKFFLLLIESRVKKKLIYKPDGMT